MTRVLNLVGDHVTSQLMQIYDEPVIHTEPDGEGYHVVLTNYALSEKPIRESVATLRELSKHILPGGELNMIERSADWYAEAVLQRKDDQIVMLHVYGTEEHPIKSMHTMRSLRELLSREGFLVYSAEPVEYPIARLSNGAEITGRNNMIAATKIWKDKTLWKE